MLSGRHILELGSGIGLPGFAAAEVAVGATVTLSDGNDTAVSLLHANKDMNESWFEGANVHVRTLVWGDSEQEEAALESDPFDCIIGSDLAVDRQAASALCTLMPAMLRHSGRSGEGSSKKPLILVAHEVRHTDSAPDGAPLDGSLSSFLLGLALTSIEGWEGQWDLAIQALTKTDRPFNLTTTTTPPVARVTSGAAIPAPEVGRPLSITRPSSKPNLAVEAHVRAVPLPTRQHGREEEEDDKGEEEKKDDTPNTRAQAARLRAMSDTGAETLDLIKHAATLPAGTVLLITLIWRLREL